MKDDLIEAMAKMGETQVVALTLRIEPIEVARLAEQALSTAIEELREKGVFGDELAYQIAKASRIAVREVAYARGFTRKSFVYVPSRAPA